MMTKMMMRRMTAEFPFGFLCFHLVQNLAHGLSNHSFKLSQTFPVTGISGIGMYSYLVEIKMLPFFWISPIYDLYELGAILSLLDSYALLYSLFLWFKTFKRVKRDDNYHFMEVLILAILQHRIQTELGSSPFQMK